MQRQCELRHCVAREPGPCRSTGAAPRAPLGSRHTGALPEGTAARSAEGCNRRAGGPRLFPTKEAAWKQCVSLPQTVNHFWKGRPLPGVFIHIGNLHKHATCLSTWTRPYAPVNTHTLPSVCVHVRMYPSASTRFLARAPSALAPQTAGTNSPICRLHPFPCLAFLPASRHALSLPSLAVSPLLPKLVI